jgi:hypothetical protein
MDKDKYKPKRGDVVMSSDHVGIFKVISVTESGRLADLHPFNPSSQLLFGKVMKGIPSSVLSPFKENASQSAARIVREATEDK